MAFTAINLKSESISLLKQLGGGDFSEGELFFHEISELFVVCLLANLFQIFLPLRKGILIQNGLIVKQENFWDSSRRNKKFGRGFPAGPGGNESGEEGGEVSQKNLTPQNE